MQPLDDAAVRLRMLHEATCETLDADADTALRIAASGVLVGAAVDSLVRLSELARLSSRYALVSMVRTWDAEEKS